MKLLLFRFGYFLWHGMTRDKKEWPHHKFGGWLMDRFEPQEDE